MASVLENADLTSWKDNPEPLIDLVRPYPNNDHESIESPHKYYFGRLDKDNKIKAELLGKYELQDIDPLSDDCKITTEVKTKHYSDLDLKSVSSLSSLKRPQLKICLVRCDETTQAVQPDQLDLTSQQPSASALKTNKTFICDICGYQTYRKNRLKEHKHRHLQTHRLKKSFLCTICNQCFGTRLSLKHHTLRKHSKERPYKCTQCKSSFAVAQSLKRHSLVHSNIKPWLCTVCHKAFKLESNLTVHIKTHTGERKFECHHCHHRFSRKEVLMKHLITHNPDLTISLSDKYIHSRTLKKKKSKSDSNGEVCSVCKQKFHSVESLRIHMETHPRTLWKCASCGYKSKSKAQLKRHIMVKHNENHAFNCSECGKCFPTEQYLKNHKFTHGPRNFNCDMCDSAFYTKRDLLHHSTTHESVKKHLCSHCGHRSHFKADLEKHMLTHLKEFLIKSFKCTLCNYSTAHKGYFRIHCQKHSEERPFKCQKCDYASNTKYYLKRHQTVHSTVKPFKCSICDFQTSRGQVLHNHIRRHSDDRPFKCQICDKTFKMPSTLSNHKKTHVKCPLLYKCTICDKKYSSKGVLQKHIKSHNKKYKCSMCNFETSKKPVLENHMIRHDQDLPFQCNICNLRYKNRDIFCLHLNSHDKVAVNCAHCDFNCVTKLDLQQHLKENH